MSMSKLNFILELAQPNRLLCDATWKGRSPIRVVCAGVHALRFTYHATPALDLPLPDLETTLNSILWGSPILNHIQACVCTHTQGSRTPTYCHFLIGYETLWNLKVCWLSSSRWLRQESCFCAWTADGQVTEEQIKATSLLPGPCWWANLLGMSVF